MGQAARQRSRRDPPKDTLPQARTREGEAGWSDAARELGHSTLATHAAPLAQALLATGDHWTLRIIAALAERPLRLNELRIRLPGISTGVLDRHLQQMVTQGLVVRERYRELPPRVEYRLDAAGEELVPVAVELARWGIRHM